MAGHLRRFEVATGCSAFKAGSNLGVAHSSWPFERWEASVFPSHVITQLMGSMRAKPQSVLA